MGSVSGSAPRCGEEWFELARKSVPPPPVGSPPVRQRNNVKVFGRGTQPMIFSHGFGCDQHMWRFITPAFEDDYRIVLFDYVGSGKSDLRAYDPERYATLDGYASDVLDVCHA